MVRNSLDFINKCRYSFRGIIIKSLNILNWFVYCVSVPKFKEILKSHIEKSSVQYVIIENVALYRVTLKFLLLQTNTFQLAVVTDGVESYAIFNYDQLNMDSKPYHQVCYLRRFAHLTFLTKTNKIIYIKTFTA